MLKNNNENRLEVTINQIIYVEQTNRNVIIMYIYLKIPFQKHYFSQAK